MIQKCINFKKNNPTKSFPISQWGQEYIIPEYYKFENNKQISQQKHRCGLVIDKWYNNRDNIIKEYNNNNINNDEPPKKKRKLNNKKCGDNIIIINDNSNDDDNSYISDNSKSNSFCNENNIYDNINIQLSGNNNLIKLNNNNNNNNNEIDGMDIQDFRGFAFLHQTRNDITSKIDIKQVWKEKDFINQMNNNPFDKISPENMALVLARNLLKGKAILYGTMEHATVYSEDSPLDLWNLYKYGPFSLFNEKERMSGIQEPYIYLGNQNTIFPFHREDMNLYAVNHLLWGNKKIWYCIDSKDTSVVLDLIRIQFNENNLEYNIYENKINPFGFNKCKTPLQHKSIFFDPYLLLCLGINVIFIEQLPGDIVITPPAGIHGGFNQGPNIAESMNFILNYTSPKTDLILNKFDNYDWKLYITAQEFLLKNDHCLKCKNGVFFDLRKLVQRGRINKEYKNGLPPISIVEPPPNILNNNNENEYDLVDISNKEAYYSNESKFITDQLIGNLYYIYPVYPNATYYKNYHQVGILCSYAPPEDTEFYEVLFGIILIDFKNKPTNLLDVNQYMYVSKSQILWEYGMSVQQWNKKLSFDLDDNILMWYPKADKDKYKKLRVLDQNIFNIPYN